MKRREKCKLNLTAWGSGVLKLTCLSGVLYSAKYS